MSGRSAYVRKKITETKPGEKGTARGRAKSTTSSDDNATISDFPMPLRQDTGIGTTNARFLKFSEPIRESEPLDLKAHQGYGNNSSGSQSGGSVDGRRELGPNGSGHFRGPLEDFAYARARRPNIRTEDVSGIEKSGLRSTVDKKSEGVRRGLVKAFTFGKKNKNSDDRGLDFRPQSSATVRPPMGGLDNGSDADLPTDPRDLVLQQRRLQQHQNNMMLQQQQQQQQQQHQQQHTQQQLQPSPMEDQQAWDASSNFMSPPPSSKLPPIPSGATSSTPPIKRWIGAGRPVQRWNKLRKDPELWDPNGDVLVFFGHKGQQPRPNPSFRLSSHIIEATESRYLITLLREGSTEEDLQLPPSPMGAPPMLQRHLAGFAGSPGRSGQQLHHLGPHGQGLGYGHNGYGMGQPTPPISEDASLGEADGQISYEMYFPTPPSMSKAEQLRYHITTRNVFALLYHASLVGLTLYQALSDLHARLESYMLPETDNVGTIINYLGARGIDDVRNDPETAVSILAWSESPIVRWEEGWRESFLHCGGMYASLEACADFRNVTPITRALLERACLETQLRVQAAEERLADFQYVDMWPPAVATTANPSGPVMPSPAKAAADRLQMFLLAHYTRVYGRWPPLPPPPVVAPVSGAGLGAADLEDDMWLTRTVAQALQKDFAALYDYLVDRDVVWDVSEARAGRKWMLVSESGNKAFEADTPDLPMTDMLVEFDNKSRFPHVPHPYPLVPESIPPSGPIAAAAAVGGGVDKKSEGAAAAAAGPGRGGATTSSRANAVERRVQLAYTVATNMLILGSDFHQSDLIEAFSKFEKMDRVGEVDPSTARRGRWVLIYGILQTLASVSVDALNMRYRDGVAYHLSPRLKGAKMPPWRSMGGGGGGGALVGSSDEAAHELSHCWLVPRVWAAASNNHTNSNSGNESSATSSGDSGNTSPVRRNSLILGRFHDRNGGGGHGGGGGGGYAFPRPPATDGYTVRSSSTTGYRTPYGGRSVRSSASLAGGDNNNNHGGGGDGYPSPPFGFAGTFSPPPSSYGGAASVISSNSAMSENSSVRTGGLSAPHARKNGRPSKMGRPIYTGTSMYSNMAGGGGGGGGSGGITPVEEVEWPMRVGGDSESEKPAKAGRNSTRKAGGGGRRPSGPPVLPGLAGIPDPSSPGGFLMLDEPADTDTHSNYTTEGSGNEQRRRRKEKTGGGRMARLGDKGGSSSRERSPSGGRDGSSRERGGGGGGGGGRSERPLLSRDVDDADRVVPMIRDFDDLDVIDDYAP
ncbi:hypothetical protein SPI_04328 [Niveomyces insectorum RCEF 264]|uniref:DUF8004 domain-containing protein n=1 Tax=Niveomyces insectorum RCEF 264 TaxID=1081102 RepID=A0A167VMJ9_9HYPO|nr:hypothetical protein SPI_04328 [Niveomyces insectorum RCEF 264]